ncbi:hypothetical protein SNOG_13621 [Parastagonospora nodorum SN15]|uniref:Uncharacterized protein n=1 Tax=Phaeosphaeria nodorum (strain SN15 / ATCC MYA-4574 / FGSC 10173) TaxID=321614 RepID=Q0U3P3_PHANO|nr:hypothetical protein SNOG_13621 [Parastagonospora nodorum SN15]EAT79068.1 hypothetical protein SNOG_13621 [Parastagonospora nodorum SN15]
MWWLGQQLSPQAGLLDVVGMTFLTIARAEYCFNAALDQAALYLHVHGLLQGRTRVTTPTICCAKQEAKDRGEPRQTRPSKATPDTTRHGHRLVDMRQPICVADRVS